MAIPLLGAGSPPDPPFDLSTILAPQIFERANKRLLAPETRSQKTHGQAALVALAGVQQGSTPSAGPSSLPWPGRSSAARSCSG